MTMRPGDVRLSLAANATHCGWYTTSTSRKIGGGLLLSSAHYIFWILSWEMYIYQPENFFVNARHVA